MPCLESPILPGEVSISGRRFPPLRERCENPRPETRPLRERYEIPARIFLLSGRGADFRVEINTSPGEA